MLCLEVVVHRGIKTWGVSQSRRVVDAEKWTFLAASRRLDSSLISHSSLSPSLPYIAYHLLLPLPRRSQQTLIWSRDIAVRIQVAGARCDSSLLEFGKGSGDFRHRRDVTNPFAHQRIVIVRQTQKLRLGSPYDPMQIDCRNTAWHDALAF